MYDAIIFAVSKPGGSLLASMPTTLDAVSRFVESHVKFDIGGVNQHPTQPSGITDQTAIRLAAERHWFLLPCYRSITNTSEFCGRNYGGLFGPNAVTTAFGYGSSAFAIFTVRENVKGPHSLLLLGVAINAENVHVTPGVHNPLVVESPSIIEALNVAKTCHGGRTFGWGHDGTVCAVAMVRGYTTSVDRQLMTLSSETSAIMGDDTKVYPDVRLCEAPGEWYEGIIGQLSVHSEDDKPFEGCEMAKGNDYFIGDQPEENLDTTKAANSSAALVEAPSNSFRYENVPIKFERHIWAVEDFVRNLKVKGPQRDKTHLFPVRVYKSRLDLQDS